MQKRAWIEIDIAKIRRNVNTMKLFTGKTFLACVKANCYGMGMTEIALGIESVVDYFGVATLNESLELRNAGIAKPILLLGTVLPDEVEDAVSHGITISLCNKEILKEAGKNARKYKREAIVHINVDTGMGRVGIPPSDAKNFVEEVIKEKGVCLEGIFTHFPTAGWKDKSYSVRQLKIFNGLLADMEKKVRFKFKHVESSSAIVNLKKECASFNMARIGILLFGIYPNRKFSRKLPLDFVLKCYSRVFFVKDVPKNTRLSYGLSFCAKRKTTVATVGIGYGDGLRRALSNRLALKIAGANAQIIGNICMDQTLLNVTGKNVSVGDTVEVFGKRFDIEKMAELTDTVAQEILCGFGSRRLEKVYKNE